MKKNLLLSTLFMIALISCKDNPNQSIKIRAHHFSAADTAFLFPDEYRKKNYRDRDFEQNSRWFNNFGEQKLFDSAGYTDYIRLLYGRSFDNGIIVVIDANKLVVKEEDIPKNDYNTHLDSSLLTIEERRWLNFHPYYWWLKKYHQTDSAKVILSILKEFPDIEDQGKNSFLKFKAERFSADSLIYVEVAKPIDHSVIKDLFQKIDSTGFWLFKNTYFESVMDGSGFCLEIRNGNKYHCVYCDNCLVKELVYLRDEILKFTKLKKDEIY